MHVINTIYVDKTNTFPWKRCILQRILLLLICSDYISTHASTDMFKQTHVHIPTHTHMHMHALKALFYGKIKKEGRKERHT